MSPANDKASGINPSWSHIELSGADVTDAYLENATGRLDLHSCASYHEAIALAEEARSALEVGAPLVDGVGEGR